MNLISSKDDVARRRRIRRMDRRQGPNAVVMPPFLRLVTLVAALAAWLALAVPADATLTQVSFDPFANSTSQHKAEVEPDTFSYGSMVVGAFQVGRFFNGGASDIGFATSTDSASTWTSGFLPGITKITTAQGAGPYDRVSDPSVAYDAKHNVWLISSLALTELSGGGIRGAAVLVSRSTDGGLTWGNPVTVAAAGPGADFDKDWTACDNTLASPHYGNCYTTWDDFGDGSRVKMSTSGDGGLTWGAAKNTADNAAGLGGQPVVQPDGTVIVPLSNAFETAILAFRSSDGGGSWSSAAKVYDVNHHRVAGSLRTGPLASAEVDGAGKVYVAWQDCRFRTGCSSNDIVVSTSTDGTSWSPVTRVPIDDVASTVDHFIPGLAVDRATSGAAGRVALTYYYYPTAPCTSATCQLYVGSVSSADGGASWSPATQLAGPMSITSLAATTQGYMVGDYISTSYLGANPSSIFVVANPPSGGALDEAMYSPTGSGPSPTPPSPPPGPIANPSGSLTPQGAVLGAEVTSSPSITGLTLTPTVFLPASSGSSIARAVGADISYSVSQPSTTTFTVKRALPGRRRGRSCAKPTRLNRRAKRCTRYLRLRGSFFHRDSAGPHRLRFTGRLNDSKLRPGKYRLVAVPRSPSGKTGRAVQASFKITATTARHRSTAR